MSGTLPALPLSYEAMRRRAKRVLSAGAYGYVAGGAGAEDTMRSNREAFRRWEIVPRMLRDVGVRDLSTEVLGMQLPAPLLLAPIGVQSIVHRDGELATARAAAATGVPYTHSTAASHSIEQAAEAMGDAPRWYQLYWPNDRSSPRASCAAPRPPATGRSSSRSTRPCCPGARATCR